MLAFIKVSPGINVGSHKGLSVVSTLVLIKVSLVLMLVLIKGSFHGVSTPRVVGSARVGGTDAELRSWHYIYERHIRERDFDPGTTYTRDPGNTYTRDPGTTYASAARKGR
jgi:hypothetical protein